MSDPLNQEDLLAFDPKADDFMNHPHEHYRRLRSTAPVFLDPRHDIYFVTSYDLVAEVMRDPKRFSSRVDRAAMREGGLPQAVLDIRAQGFPPALTMSNNDEPSHDMYKDLVAPFFTPRNLGAFEPVVEQQVASLIERLPEDQPFDFVAAFSVPLPIHVIGHALGMTEYGNDLLKRWSDAFADEIGLLTSEERAVEIAQLTLDCHRAMVSLCDARRDDPRDDIISRLAAAEITDPQNGEARALDSSELVSLLTQLLVAGNETTTNTLSGGMRRLASDPTLLTRLRQKPEDVPRFVEELLRLESPVQGQFRKATEDTTLGGEDIPAGALLHVRLASANRDEAYFGTDNNTLNLDGRQQPPHKSFGMGMHFCVGAMLSRLELKTAFTHLAEAVESAELAVPEEELEYHTHFHLRGLEALPVRLRMR